MTKALAKSPADRFTSAGSFATALGAGAAGRRTVRARSAARSASRSAPSGSPRSTAVALWAVRSGRLGGPRRGVDLRDHTQLTANGRTSVAAISADGKQFVYVTRIRDPQQSPVSLTMQDLDGTAARRLIDSVAFIDELQMSPDRRQLLLFASINGRDGEYLLSDLGRRAAAHSGRRRCGLLRRRRLPAAGAAAGARHRRLDSRRGDRWDRTRQHSRSRRVIRDRRPGQFRGAPGSRSSSRMRPATSCA